jgi:hypothetical protein
LYLRIFLKKPAKFPTQKSSIPEPVAKTGITDIYTPSALESKSFNFIINQNDMLPSLS